MYKASDFELDGMGKLSVYGGNFERGIIQSRTTLLLVPHLTSLILRDKSLPLLNVSNDALLLKKLIGFPDNRFMMR